MRNYIFLISGAPGAGKSTISKALSKRFKKIAYLEVDSFRKLVISGFVPPVPNTEESEKQALLAYKNVTACADNYYKEGYSVVIDEVASSPKTIKAMMNNSKFVSILLIPNPKVNIDRNNNRNNKSFDTSVLNDFIETFNEKMQSRKPDWDVVIDNSKLTVEETIDKIMKELTR